MTELNSELKQLIAKEKAVIDVHEYESEEIASHKIVFKDSSEELTKLSIVVGKPYRCDHMWCCETRIEGKPNVGPTKGINSLHALCNAMYSLQRYLKLLNGQGKLYEPEFVEDIGLDESTKFNFPSRGL